MSESDIAVAVSVGVASLLGAGFAYLRAFVARKTAVLDAERARLEAERAHYERGKLIAKHRAIAWSTTRVWVHSQGAQSPTMVRPILEFFWKTLGENLAREGAEPLTDAERIAAGERIAGEIEALIALRRTLRSANGTP